MSNRPLPLLACLVILPALAQANEEEPKPGERRTLMGMKAWYEPAAVKEQGKGFVFTLYSGQAPKAGDDLGSHALNCETREVVITVKGQASPPSRILPGEDLYPLGKKLCEWDQKGFFKRMME